MAKPFVSDELWARIEPLLPKREPPTEKGGRPPLKDRAALTGILFVLKTSIPWEDLPQEMHCGCGMTCWRRLRDWQQAGVWDKLHELLLAELRAADKIDWSRAAVDSSSVRAVGGGQETGPNPTDRRKLGSKHHLIVDGHGVPLEVQLSGANKPDINQPTFPRSGANRVAHGRDPTNSMATEPTTRSRHDASCAGWALNRSWRSDARNMAADLEK
jgi:transposase